MKLSLSFSGSETNVDGLNNGSFDLINLDRPTIDQLIRRQLIDDDGNADEPKDVEEIKTKEFKGHYDTMDDLKATDVSQDILQQENGYIEEQEHAFQDVIADHTTEEV